MAVADDTLFLPRSTWDFLKRERQQLQRAVSAARSAAFEAQALAEEERYERESAQAREAQAAQQVEEQLATLAEQEARIAGLEARLAVLAEERQAPACGERWQDMGLAMIVRQWHAAWVSEQQERSVLALQPPADERRVRIARYLRAVDFRREMEAAMRRLVTAEEIGASKLFQEAYDAVG